jgi:hypothetical protein
VHLFPPGPAQLTLLYILLQTTGMLLQAHATKLSSDELLRRGTLLRTQGNVVFKQVTRP